MGDAAIGKVGVVGAGTMGIGIAIVAARGGVTTLLTDTDVGKLERVKADAERFFRKSVALGKMEAVEADNCLARLITSPDARQLDDCDLVIEAIFESLAAKRDLFARLADICKPQTIFATNTSTLSITQLAGASGRADRFVGLHFCVPAQIMRLVEVTPGLETSEATLGAAWDFCERVGQIPIRTKDTPGFILNYFVIPFHNAAIRLVEQGVAEPKDIDTAIKAGLGHAMGPLELVDMVGLDTQLLLCEAFYETTRDPRMAVPHLVRQMVAAGRLGRKSGRGFHDYSTTGRASQ